MSSTHLKDCRGESSGDPDPNHLPPPEETPIFVVDDDKTIVEAVSHFLTEIGYRVRGFVDPEMARDAIKKEAPHLLFVDRKMPGIGGFDLARIALEEDPDMGVVVLTGVREVESAIEAFRLGAADYLLKPLDFGEIGRAARRTLIRRAQETYHRDAEVRVRQDAEAHALELQRKNRLLEGVTEGALNAFVRVLEQKLPHFRGHSQAVAGLSEKLAGALGLSKSDVWACKIAGFLHDIGMISVPDQIQQKTGPLLPEESAKMKDHCQVGWELLSPFSHLGHVPTFVLHHHERLDGSGYPLGLAGEEIPLGAQIIAAADSFRALVEPRPFRDPSSPSEAMEILRGSAGVWHSERVLGVLAQVAPSASA